MSTKNSHSDAYEEALRFIASRSGYERGFVADPFADDDVIALGLRRTRALLDQLNNPERGMRIVHIAGTKGKGSTAVTVEALAREAGLTTGLYSTPHLHSFRERIQINRVPVGEDEFAELQRSAAMASQMVERSKPNIGQPTAFELITAMAFDAFQRKQVDVAILETGLGGRFDATNVCTPEVTAITSISFDHMAILGDTLEEIAREKAGIIKPGVPVVIGPQRPEVTETIEAIALDRGAPVFKAGRDWIASGPHRSATISGPWGNWTRVSLSLAGSHQVENAGIAMMTAYLVDSMLLENEQQVRAALKRVTWPGRFERMKHQDVELVFDGAHNVDSIRRLADLLAEEFPETEIVSVFGAAVDKEHAGMLAELGRVSASIVVTESSSPRSATAEQLVKASRENNLTASPVPEPGPALDYAIELARNLDGFVCVTGSLYLVADLREAASLTDTDDRRENQILFGYS